MGAHSRIPGGFFMILPSLGIVGLVLVGGLIYFRSMEQTFRM